MRCQACNAELNDYEAVRKDSNGEYLDICSQCLRDIRIFLLGTESGDTDYVSPTLDPDDYEYD
jgi:hypothetical protein